MKKLLLLFFTLLTATLLAQQQTATYSINPSVFEDNQSITITINGNSINEATWGVTGNALYLWAWSFDINDTNILDCPTNGIWTNSSETNRLNYNTATDTYTYTLTPNAFYNRFTGIGKMGFLVKAKDGTGDKKSQDIVTEVGAFNFTLINPIQNSTTVQNSGGSISVSATNTNGTANYQLKANGSLIAAATQTTSSYSYIATSIITNTEFELTATQGAITYSKKFSVIIKFWFKKFYILNSTYKFILINNA
jgi:hypothetical protein